MQGLLSEALRLYALVWTDRDKQTHLRSFDFFVFLPFLVLFFSFSFTQISPVSPLSSLSFSPVSPVLRWLVVHCRSQSGRKSAPNRTQPNIHCSSLPSTPEALLQDEPKLTFTSADSREPSIVLLTTPLGAE